MKASFPISLLALVVAAFALIRSYQVQGGADERRIAVAVEEALRDREKEFVDEFRPRFQAMFGETGDEFGKGWKPETIEELFEPLTRLVGSMDEGTTGSEVEADQ